MFDEENYENPYEDEPEYEGPRRYEYRREPTRRKNRIFDALGNAYRGSYRLLLVIGAVFSIAVLVVFFEPSEPTVPRMTAHGPSRQVTETMHTGPVVGDKNIPTMRTIDSSEPRETAVTPEIPSNDGQPGRLNSFENRNTIFLPIDPVLLDNHEWPKPTATASREAFAPPVPYDYQVQRDLLKEQIYKDKFVDDAPVDSIVILENHESPSTLDILLREFGIPMDSTVNVLLQDEKHWVTVDLFETSVSAKGTVVRVLAAGYNLAWFVSATFFVMLIAFMAGKSFYNNNNYNKSYDYFSEKESCDYNVVNITMTLLFFVICFFNKMNNYNIIISVMMFITNCMLYRSTFKNKIRGFGWLLVAYAFWLALLTKIEPPHPLLASFYGPLGVYGPAFVMLASFIAVVSMILWRTRAITTPLVVTHPLVQDVRIVDERA